MKRSGNPFLSVASARPCRAEIGEKKLAFWNKDTRWLRILNQFLSQTADGVYGVNHLQRIVFWNKTCERIFGIDSRSAIGKPCYEVVSGEDCHGNPICFSHCMAFTAARQGRVVENFEIQIPRREVWVNISTVFVRDSRPALPSIIHLVRETCNPRRLRLEDRLEQMLLCLEKLTMHEKASPSTNNIPSLTTREREVLACLSLGKHAKDIAQKFGVSQSTVRSHIKNILFKLEVHSQLEAIAYAYKHKLV